MFFIFSARKLSVNRKDLGASTLVVLSQENPVLDPLAVQHLDNGLYMSVLQVKIIGKLVMS